MSEVTVGLIYHSCATQDTNEPREQERGVGGVCGGVGAGAVLLERQSCSWGEKAHDYTACGLIPFCLYLTHTHTHILFVSRLLILPLSILAVHIC